MMELRPIQAALFAGRCASRRATATPSTLSYPRIPSFYRYLSSTRPSLSEAEATAPAPTPSMQEWNRQQQQRQRTQQSEQPQPRAWGSAAGTKSPGVTGGIASLLRPNKSTLSSPPTPTPPTPGTFSETMLAPWAKPSSEALRRNQANRLANDANRPSILEDLKIISPTSSDLTDYPGMAAESASEIKYRLRPSIGRTVHIDARVDLARGLGLLNLHVRKNKVSQDASRQRFHERPGLKRKRLRGERWRVRFKDGFKATCNRVSELARQGW